MMRKLTHQEIVARQGAKLNNRPLPITVVVNNIRSLYNVGSIFRTADGVGIEKIWLCGITGHPPQSQIGKTALGAQERVPWQYSKEAAPVLSKLKEKNYQIILLEQIENSISYDKFEPAFPVCLVIGSEIEGVSDELISFCDQAVEIEMAGIKNSLNVSVAFGIMSFYLRSKLFQQTCLKERI